MSLQLIHQYHNQLHRIQQYGGSKKETTIRKPFQDLLEHYARQRNLELIAELDLRTRTGHTIYPDGTLKDALRQDWGYWESKDEDDDLDREIAKKFAKGYPQSNILFEDSHTAVLIQNGQEVGRVPLQDAPTLDTLLTRFVSYESAEVREFREAIESFAQDVPDLAEMLRLTIRQQYDQNPTFHRAADDFLELCQEAINPSMEPADVREMIVQHILTQDIFTTVFGDAQFHGENIIAQELGDVVNTFYKEEVRRRIDGRIGGYTNAIKARAAQIANHHEKQKFLKTLYETFYKAYNPKAADRLGIVYTPNEIVRFMIQAADHLCYQHFGKGLGHEGVEILDPATGTGTFITELIEYLPPHQLAHKYAHELHCNEVSILPYYIANLNIEYSYQQKMKQYVAFENILFVDTLDNMGFRTQHRRQLGLFGLTDANLARIERQNEREISVIIGNPPYNANQLNENENNKNREYPEIDKRIKATYIAASTAQKTKLYDMYSRFYRWASDRLQDNGIIAFITNRSFLDARTFDGFRKVVADEFSHIYVVDLGGDVRKNPKLSGPKHNVFAIQTGVAMMFMVRKEAESGDLCRIWYVRRPEMEEAVDKLRFLAANPFAQLRFERIMPSRNNNWLNLAENNWDDLLPLASKEHRETIFSLSAPGIKTNRDEWVYGFSKNEVVEKIQFLIDRYNKQVDAQKDKQVDANLLDYDIKWSSNLKSHLGNRVKAQFDDSYLVSSIYRPFVSLFYYSDKLLSDRLTAHHFSIWGNDLLSDNVTISISGIAASKPFQALASSKPIGFDTIEKNQCLPLYQYDQHGRVDNITDWALTQFRTQYALPHLSKQDIFHYVYAVLHHPAYRQKYKLNLKREFPRIPFYDDFAQWATWGEQLMALHLQYETATPTPLPRHETDPDTSRRAYKSKLKADKKTGLIELDTLTTLSGIPPAAWAYKLGNRSALE